MSHRSCRSHPPPSLLEPLAIAVEGMAVLHVALTCPIALTSSHPCPSLLELSVHAGICFPPSCKPPTKLHKRLLCVSNTRVLPAKPKDFPLKCQLETLG